MSQPSAAGTQLEVRPQWLALRSEEVIEPDLKVIDSHHHLWDPPGRRYLFEEFLDDLRTGHDVYATVFVQCHAMYRADGPDAFKPVGETEFAAGAAARSESGLYGPTKICAAIVGSLDYRLGDRVEPVLEAHIRAGGGRFRGIRGRTMWDPSEAVHKLPTAAGILMEPATRAAVACIERFGLSLDVWAYHPQLPEVIDLCRAFPALPIIVNHIGGPLGIGPYEGMRGEVFRDWSASIATLGSLPNTFMKIGGMALRVSGYDFHRQPLPPSSDDLVRAWRPYAETCMQAFGPARCMFESNFPVDKAMCSYPVLWNAYKKLCAPYSTEEKHEMLFGTAARVYRIEY